ncbi:MAG: DUF4105 domain-containing protein [Candidatus Omnitrophica bacterium]|nr:DUF4105 domain-containing protein [Candidatus Omnitrophota bacterium]
MQLAKDPFWKDLLHFKGNSSQIIDDRFFLSKNGRVNPEEELCATLEAYFTNKHNIKRKYGDKDIICIFPARYTWLDKKLNLPGYKIDNDTCPRLTEWTRINEIEDISLVFVSGYLGNPASSFGHALLNFKLRDNEDLMGLFDTSITYGAQVPPNENVLFYIFKGLLGGYHAGFTDKFFYAHDQVYSSREFRDMWEYTLELDDFNRKMLIYHIAELLSHEYRYYFLSSNCAQRVAVVLDMFIEEDLYNFNYPIYIPEELFHRLRDIDRERREKGEKNLIKKIKFIPSAQRYLFYEIARLNDNERKVYENIMKNQDVDFSIYLKELSSESSINVLNVLLAYQYYRIMASNDDPSQEALKRYKDKVLLERLRLPAKKDVPLDIPEISSPDKTSSPSSINIGFIVEDDGDAFGTLGATVFRKESVGLNVLEYSELVALDLNLGFLNGSDNVFLNSFDFIKIRDFKTLCIKEANENPFSWSFEAGVNRYDINDDNVYDYSMEGGVGLVNKVKGYGICYGFLNVSSHSIDQQYRMGPSAGFVIGQDRLKLQIDYSLDFGLEYYGYDEITKAKVQYQINKNNAIQLHFENNNGKRSGITYFIYW